MLREEDGLRRDGGHRERGEHVEQVAERVVGALVAQRADLGADEARKRPGRDVLHLGADRRIHQPTVELATLRGEQAPKRGVIQRARVVLLEQAQRCHRVVETERCLMCPCAPGRLARRACLNEDDRALAAACVCDDLSGSRPARAGSPSQIANRMSLWSTT